MTIEPGPGRYETASRFRAGSYPRSWGAPEGGQYSAERRNWVQRNLRNPQFKLEQLRAVERRALLRDIEDLDDQLRAAGVTPPPIPDEWR